MNTKKSDAIPLYLIIYRCMDDISKTILQGITFKSGASKPKADKKIKTKAKKKAYITGAHGSGAAKMKAEYRRQRANRHK